MNFKDMNVIKYDVEQQGVEAQRKLTEMASTVTMAMSESATLDKTHTRAMQLSEGGSTLMSLFEKYRNDSIASLRQSPEGAMRLSLAGSAPQLTDDEEQSIRLNFLAQMSLSADGQNAGTTRIGDISTEFDATVYEYPAMVEQDTVMMPYLQSRFYNSQEAIYQTQSALVGYLPASMRGAAGQVIDAPAYTLNTFSCGYFAGQVNLDMEKLSISRDIRGINGTQSSYAMERSFAQLVVMLTQLMNSIAYDTRVNNGYTYSFSPYTGQGIGFMSYGRPSENIYSFDEPAMIKEANGSFSVNPASNQFQELMYTMTKEENGIIINTKSLTDGFALNSETKNAFAQQIVSNNNTPQAIAFGAGLRYSIDADDLYASTPWLQSFKFMEVTGRAMVGINDFGAVNNIAYYMPTGYMLPLFREYNGQPMQGMFAFMPNERISWLSNVQGIPNSITPISDPRSVGMRVVTSQDTHANDPSYNISFTMKTAYLNMLSATDYMFKCFKDA